MQSFDYILESVNAGRRAVCVRACVCVRAGKHELILTEMKTSVSTSWFRERCGALAVRKPF